MYMYIHNILFNIWYIVYRWVCPMFGGGFHQGSKHPVVPPAIHPPAPNTDPIRPVEDYPQLLWLGVFAGGNIGIYQA